MKKKLLFKCLITLSLFVSLPVLTPIPFLPTVKAEAAETTKDKSDIYRLNVTSITLAKGKTQALKTYYVGEKATTYFKSADDEVASVNGDGVISANKVGTTAITVTIKEGSDSTSLTCDVTVGPAAVSVKWTQSIVVISKNSVDTLKVILKPSNTVEDVMFTSRNSSIVSITQGGRISAKNLGLAELRAYIDATESNGSQKYDSCTVIVVNEDNVAKLEKYFSEHTELDKVPEEDLVNALGKFFNEEFDQSTSSSLVSSLDRYLNKVFDLN